jgi:hypothetical protein
MIFDETRQRSTRELEATNTTTEWREHEHISEQAQLAAQNLVDLAGSPELAKNAISVVEQRQAPESNHRATTFARWNDQFVKALEVFETSVERPVMSGDLVDWVIAAKSAGEHLGVLLHGDVQRMHRDLYASILKEDSELSSQVEKLRATDSQLADCDFDKLMQSLQNLLVRAQSAAQDELKVMPLHTEVVKSALAFIISARTQETAIATWFSEAFNRERGCGD